MQNPHASGAAPAAPRVSVVMPVFNGVRYLERALASVYRQTVPCWEVVAADDGSTDGSLELLRRHAEREPRVRVVTLASNGGPARARNAALRVARGGVIAYLDCDDEFYPDHLARVCAWSGRSDVLLFRYDIVTPRDGGESSRAYDPTPYRPSLWRRNISTPLGVAHRRGLLERVGGFDEAARFEQDWELWKRLAAVGARALSVPHKSGRYHVRPDSHARRRARDPQRHNPAASLPLPLPPAVPTVTPPPRVLFCGFHCYLDPSGGATLGTRALLEGLTARGWACGVVCGPRLDHERPPEWEELFRRLSVEPRRQSTDTPAAPATLYHAAVGGVPVSTLAFAADARRRKPTDDESRVFVDVCAGVMRRFRPDVVFTYGGGSAERLLIGAAKALGCKVVFAVHNTAYERADLFRDVDAVMAPSRFAAAYYRRKLSAACVALPCPWDWRAVDCRPARGNYLTFINPQPAKGVYWFAGVARELARRRPDIPVLVVDGRGDLDTLKRRGLDLLELPGLRRVAHTPTPREVYALSRAVLMPSLCEETFGRVAAEAMANGIPVLASDRGALPDTVGAAGVVLPVLTCSPPFGPCGKRVLSADEAKRTTDEDEDVQPRADRQAAA